MDDQNQTQPSAVTGSPIYQESQEKNAKWLWLLIILIIIGALVFAFFRGIGPFAAISPFAKQASPTPESSPFVESSPVTESSPSPSSDTSSLKRGDVTVKVLNGSGTTGKAATVRDFLEGLGWKVSSIGNADNSDYATTEVQFKSDSSDFKDLIVSDLSSKYSASAGTKSLESSSSADLVVIVGTK